MYGSKKAYIGYMNSINESECHYLHEASDVTGYIVQSTRGSNVLENFIPP